MRLTALVAGTMLATCLAPAAAQAGWSANQPVTGTGPDTTNTRIAGNTGSNPLVVWTKPILGINTVQAAHLKEDGTSGPVLTLSAPLQNAVSPVVAVSPNGTAAVAWVSTSGTSNVVQSVTVNQSDQVGTVGNRSEPGPAGQDAAGPRVAIKDDGSMAVTWRKFNGAFWTVQARVVSAAGVATPIQTFNGIHFQDTDFPDVAMVADGNFQLAWGVGTGALGNVATIGLSADGTTLLPEPTYVFPTTALDDQGVSAPAGVTGAPANARLTGFTSGPIVLAWIRDIAVDPAEPAGPAVRSVESSGISNGILAALTTRISSTAFDVSQLSLARAATRLDGGTTLGGNASLAAWTTEVPGNRQIQASRILPGGRGGILSTFPGDVGSQGFPEPALSTLNFGTVAWTESTADPAVNEAVAGRLSAGGIPSSVQSLTTGSLTSTQAPRIAMGPQGVPTVAFDAVEGGNLNSNFSRFTDPGNVAVSPSVLAFGSQILNKKSPSRAVFLTSGGSTGNEVFGVNLSGPNASQFVLTGGSNCVPVIAPSDTCSIGFNFKPVSAGNKNATVTLQTESGNFFADLKGFGSARTRVSLSVKPTNRAQRRGKAGKLTASMKNTGGLVANNVRLCANGNKRVIRPKKRCLTINSIRVGQTVKRTFRARLNGRAKKGKKYAVNFQMKAGNANSRRASARLRLKG
ncbi:MAG: hypothetical protein ACSLFD_10690 [Solirubrobacterales bacterium]